MKKRKTYEVSVINKTYSKVLQDDTKFYTSDTALELVFKLLEVEYTFDSAKILLLNIDDRSFDTRDASKSIDGFTYEIEDDIVAHYGEWKAQLKFEKDGWVYVSSPVFFRIENDLGNDRPPKLTEVNNWKNLRITADGLIDDLRVELESLAKKELEIENAETTRQQAESKRQSAEQQRVEAENVRKQWFDNSQIEMENLIQNGNFKNGLARWGGGSNIQLVDNHAEFSPTARFQSISKSAPKQSDGEIIYARAIVKTDDKLVKFYVNDGKTQVSSDAQGAKGIEVTSVNFKLTQGHTVVLVKLQEERPANWTKSELHEVIAINLTKVFGSGNEPTAKEMDELIKITGYIDGKINLTQVDLLKWVLSLNRINRNALIQLGGTI